jgi:hypothetical protein
LRSIYSIMLLFVVLKSLHCRLGPSQNVSPCWRGCGSILDAFLYHARFPFRSNSDVDGLTQLCVALTGIQDLRGKVGNSRCSILAPGFPSKTSIGVGTSPNAVTVIANAASPVGVVCGFPRMHSLPSNNFQRRRRVSTTIVFVHGC